MKKAESSTSSAAGPASAQITQYIADLNDWRGKLIAQVRKLVLASSPDIGEEWKWGTPVWSCQGNLLAAGAFKDHVKLNFFKGAALPDPNGLFNAGLDAKATRAIDLHQGDKLNEPALKALIKAALALNQAGKKK